MPCPCQATGQVSGIVLLPALEKGLVEIQGAESPDRIGIGKGRIAVGAPDHHGIDSGAAKAHGVIVDIAPGNDICNSAGSNGSRYRGAGATHKPKFTFDGSAHSRALYIYPGSGDVRFYAVTGRVAPAAVDIDAAVGMIVSGYGKRQFTVSRIHGRVVGIRPQEDSLVRYKAVHGQPHMEIAGNIQGRIHTDPPDSRCGSFKAHKDELASGAAFKVLVIDGQGGSVQTEGHDGFG